MLFHTFKNINLNVMVNIKYVKVLSRKGNTENTFFLIPMQHNVNDCCSPIVIITEAKLLCILIFHFFPAHIHTQQLILNSMSFSIEQTQFSFHIDSSYSLSFLFVLLYFILCFTSRSVMFFDQIFLYYWTVFQNCLP